jgi:hypothetical protein
VHVCLDISRLMTPFAANAIILAVNVREMKQLIVLLV